MSDADLRALSRAYAAERSHANLGALVVAAGRAGHSVCVRPGGGVELDPPLPGTPILTCFVAGGNILELAGLMGTPLLLGVPRVEIHRITLRSLEPHYRNLTVHLESGDDASCLRFRAG